MSDIAFKPDEFKDVQVEFRGIIVRAEYGTPWTIAGSPVGAEFGKQVRIETFTEELDKNQYDWFMPSNKKGTKWEEWISSANKAKALDDVEVRGLTIDEKMKSFCDQIIGLDCHFERRAFASPFKKKGEDKTTRITYITKYYGRVPKDRLPIREEAALAVGEVTETTSVPSRTE